MFRKSLALVIIFNFLFPPSFCFAQSNAADALVGIAIGYYDKGCYQEALYEFSKALLIDPYHEQARQYIQVIRSKQESSRDEQINKTLDSFEQVRGVSPAPVAREVLINRELGKTLSSKKFRKIPILPKEKSQKEKAENFINVKGEYQVAMGLASPDKVIWKKANGDLNEKNFRILFGDGRHNTYDPAIFDRLRLNMDTKNLDEAGLNNISAHANITVDPWSFTGKSGKFTVNGVGGDAVELELKYWSNSGHTINENVYTLINGDSIAFPEIKVDDGHTFDSRVASNFSNVFNIPSQKIQWDFMPLREFWLDYKDEEHQLRFFPIAYQDQALTTDDPLGLSNHHTWWEESPWLSEWKPGMLNTGATPVDFTKGYWDDSLAFFTRDSDNLRLTSLRGFAYRYDGVDATFETTVASPKDLWQDYDEFNTYATASRLEYDLLYNLGLRLTHTGHFGLHESKLDGLNNVLSVDAKYEPLLGMKLLGQIATSQFSLDRSIEDYASLKRGNAYVVSLENRWPGDDIYEQDFNAIHKDGSEKSFLKSRLRAVHLDEGFESSLATYRQTRDDEFWSRHISFRKHPLYLYTGLATPMKWEDIKPFAIGDGIDAGRNVMGWRLEGLTEFCHHNLNGLFDIRNVGGTNGDFIENVSRLELTYSVTDKLTTKLLGICHDLPMTDAGVDPFIFDVTTGKKLVNTAIVGGEDPSLKTISAGFDYNVTDQFSFNTVWEHTNDSTLAADNYPRGLFNSSSFTTYTENGKVYREPISFLYSQTGFAQPPYDPFDIYKFGFSFRPMDKLEFYLDFAYNENKKAGQIDDNMNHCGLEVAYQASSKLALFFKYTYARWIDMLMLNATGAEIYNGHNNIFLESRYHLDQDSEFICQYGVGGITPLGAVTYDPFGGSLAVLDTQHILRLYYKKKF